MAVKTIAIMGAVTFMLAAPFTVFAGEFSRATRNKDSTPPNSVLPISPAISASDLPNISRERGAAILLSKAALLSLGYDPGSLDKRVSAKYKAALFLYQESHHLVASGELDAATYAALWKVVQ